MLLDKEFDAVILANGKYPEHEIPVRLLRNAKYLLCCDGAVVKHLGKGRVPDAVVGDLDSLPMEVKSVFANKLHHFPDQNSNDLTKSIKFCQERGFKSVAIVGATGLREDHTIGNIALLVGYAQQGMDVVMVTDTGLFLPMLNSGMVRSFEGQQVSIFSFCSETRITTHNLQYPIEDMPLNMWWQGTLNESLGDYFGLEFTPGPVAVYLLFKDCR
jgi:thiamine pyrophosphokinase